MSLWGHYYPESIKKTIEFLLAQELHLKSLFNHVSQKMYAELQEKFKPSVGA
jgi:hypothetical protein